MTDMTGKVVLITGGTSGIGRETAIGLAKLGAQVVVAGRDQQRGEQGVADIKQRSRSNRIDLLLADMSSMAAVRQLAADFQARYDQLDVLVNNVGYVPSERYETVDGIEATLAVNHLAPLLLTHELLPLLEASAPSRVINVTGGQVGGPIDLNNLQAEKSFLALNTYSHAKRVMMAASYEFAQRLQGTGVALNVAYPGAANTNMTSNIKPAMVPGPIRLLWPLFRVFMSNAKPESAAVSSILLASEPEYANENGNYYNTKGKRVDWPETLVTDGVPQAVWVRSMALLGLEEAVVA